MKLSRMQDIGGCRAVVENEDQVRAIVATLNKQKRWNIVRERDYIAEPNRETGYRAFHLIVEKDGRLIEVQLRTHAQHAWAELIESVDRRNPSFDLKGGRAHTEVREYYRLGAALLAARERGEPGERGILLRFRELHEKLRL